MSLTVPYTIELCRLAEPYHVKWFEEFLPPDNYSGYKAVKDKVSSTLLTTGNETYMGGMDVSWIYHVIHVLCSMYHVPCIM